VLKGRIYEVLTYSELLPIEGIDVNVKTTSPIQYITSDQKIVLKRIE